MTLRFPGVTPPPLPGLLQDEEDGTKSMKNDVFISYAGEDAGAAEIIVAALEAAKIHCFMAPRDIPPGMERAAAIVDAICETRLFLLLHSAHANRSLQMARELQLVHDRHIGVFAVRLDDSPAAPNIDFFLRRQNVFQAVPLASRLAALVDAVEARLGSQSQRRPA
jgi:hypothetical protein